MSYISKSLLDIARDLHVRTDNISLDGKHLSLAQILTVESQSPTVEFRLEKSLEERMRKSYEAMMRDIRSGRPVYGSNSSFGGQAGRVINEGGEEERVEAAKKISRGLLFLDVSVGPEFPSSVIRGAMLIRLNMLLQGVSGIRVETLDVLRQMLNEQLTPVVHQFGGIGASGDLAHNQRVVSVARGLSHAYIRHSDGRKEEATDALHKKNIPLMDLDPKEGLALVNGDNFSTAVAATIYNRLIEYYLLSVVVGAMTVEALQGTDRSFHPVLAHIRPHPGQKEAADLYRFLLSGSKLAQQEMTGHTSRPNGAKVQDVYSLRCLSQFEGVMIETIKQSLGTIELNANSVSDNPVWVPEEWATDGETPWQWVSGGNFLAMHMAEVMDRGRKIITQLIKRNDRHLAVLIDEHENNGLGANLSDPDASITQCAFKGVQIQSGMLEIYSMVLSQPVTTLFGVHEERNQDITSHALTSGILAFQNLDLLKYSLASNFLAVAQAVDLRGGPEFLSQHTRPVYEWIRGKSQKVTEERSLAGDIEAVGNDIENGTAMTLLLSSVFHS